MSRIWTKEEIFTMWQKDDIEISRIGNALKTFSNDIKLVIFENE